ncbi:hypothetical protein [Hazenella coriacea]|uniref:Uncharacterized protein n=1 Tax=Hazenella coriacea TaxID=1179467 RepID=A0A4R3LEN9_9BACL|nr:hypothetical protein [Hazenella coriacea]TCS96814.1 hypothetical protein EDD58_101456 [Hazenella coriacea]
MFSYLRRFFDYFEIFIFILILYGTTYVYPPAQETIRRVIESHRNLYIEWINVLMSIFTVMFTVGVCLIIITMFFLFILKRIDVDYKNDEGPLFGKTIGTFVRNGFWWSVNLLLLSKFSGLSEVWDYWTNFYYGVVFSKTVYNILIALIGALSFWILYMIYKNYTNEMKKRLKGMFKKNN